MENSEISKEESRWSNVKSILKKSAKKLIPIAAGWAAGMFFPPAGNILYSFLKERFKDTGIAIPIIDEILKGICKDTIEKESLDFLSEKIKELLSKNTTLSSEQLELMVDMIVRPVNESLNEALEYIKKYPKQLEDLMDEWKEDNKCIISELHLDMETGFSEVNNRIVSQNEKVLDGQKELLRKLSQIERDFNQKFNKGAIKIFGSENIGKLDLQILSKAQLNLANYSSRFDIEFDTDLFLDREKADEAFRDFLNNFLDPFSEERNLFLVLGGAGIGKTWNLTSWARRISNMSPDLPQTNKFAPFFISLRLAFERQFNDFFGASDIYNALENLKKAKETSNVTPILFIDGLDEIRPNNAKSLLIFISNITRENIPVILTCRDIDWAREENIYELHSRISDICYKHKAGKNYPITEVSCYPSLYLEKFTENEFWNALKKYNLPKKAFVNKELEEMGKYPIILRLFSEFYSEYGFLPDPNDPNNFKDIFLGKGGDPPEKNILGRFGIIGPKRSYLIQIISRFIDKGDQLKHRDLSDLIEQHKLFNLIRSSGMIREEWTPTSTRYIVDEKFKIHLKHLVYLNHREIENRDRKKEVTQDANKKRKNQEDLDLDNHNLKESLIQEEIITLGYFLLKEELYQEKEDSEYFGGPFHDEISFPRNWSELNNRHHVLLKIIYPKDSIYQPKDVIESLKSKGVFEITPDRWSDTRATHYPGLVVFNNSFDLSKQDNERITEFVGEEISKLVKECSNNKILMMELYLLEDRIPEDAVKNLIGNEFELFIKIGFNNRKEFRESWRVIFNKNNDKFNQIERKLTIGKLELIGEINSLKESIKDELNPLEKQFLSIFSFDPIIFDKEMGTNYGEQTLNKIFKRNNLD
ncbi:MAG: hypothetical protein P8Y70_15425 [Candidatus Lokiarchaeota archaeon]